MASHADAKAKEIVVHRKTTRLEYFEGGKLVGWFNCVVGAKGATPVGKFSVLSKVKDKVSTKYNDAPMPFSLQFSRDWCAIHGTSPLKSALGIPVISFYQWAMAAVGKEADVGSHGCVGLSNGNAETLFNWCAAWSGGPLFGYGIAAPIRCRRAPVGTPITVLDD